MENEKLKMVRHQSEVGIKRNYERVYYRQKMMSVVDKEMLSARISS